MTVKFTYEGEAELPDSPPTREGAIMTSYEIEKLRLALLCEVQTLSERERLWLIDRIDQYEQ